MTATSKNHNLDQKVEYKGYTIEPDSSYPYAMGRFKFYPTEEGVQDDADFDGESYKYCGNCKWADSITDAKWEIDDMVPFQVRTLNTVSRRMNITKFTWLSDAVKFAVIFNGDLSVTFDAP